MKTITRFSRNCLLVLFAVFAFTQNADASHYRHGTLSWSPAPIAGQPNRIEFKLNVAYRGGSYSIGQQVYGEYMYYGDGQSEYIVPTVTSTDAAADYHYSTAVFYHNYTGLGTYQVDWANSCCRISQLSNNSNGNYSMRTIVNVGSGNSSPISSLSPIVNVPVNINAQFQIPSNDPDGNPLTFRLANGSDVAAGGAYSQPSGFSISPTGLATFNTVGKSVGSLWSAAVVIEDGQTSTIIDFIIKVTQQSTAPVFDYSLTPSNGYVFQIAPGQNLTFSVRATDSDPGDNVRLNAVGLPVGVSFSPSLPTLGNPVQSTFSWTPNNSNLGTNVISFIAQDNVGVQTTTSVTIQVSLKPVFDVPPSPANNVEIQYLPGTAISHTLQASDPDAQDLVKIISASGMPSGATLSSPLPSPAGNPTSIGFNWTPQASDWGDHVITFTAQDTYNDVSNHKLALVINRQPEFTSTPVTNGQVAFAYNYQITASDLDIPFGDVLAIEATTLPSWLSFVDNGDGTASLSGTPTAAGTYQVDLFVEDIHHHNYPTPAINNAQSFSITVIDCTDPVFTSCPGLITVSSSATSCSATVNYSTSVSGTPQPTISYAFSGATTGSGSGNGSGSVFNVGITHVTITASNSCSSTTCSFDVSVADHTPPVAVAHNATVYLNANGTGTLSVGDVEGGSSDNCGIASSSLSQTSFDCSGITSGTNQVTIVSDANWKRSTYQYPTPWPNVPFASSTNNLPAASTYTVAVNNSWPYNGTLIFQPPIPGVQPITANGGFQFFRRTFNLNGNTQSARIRLSVDNLAEVFVNGVSIANENNFNNSNNFGGTAYHDLFIDANGVVNGYQNGDLFDVVSIANISNMFVAGMNEIVVVVANSNGSDEGGLTFRMDVVEAAASQVTYTVVDNNGNTSSTPVFISVVDNIAPTAVAQNVTVNLNASGSASITAAMVNAGSTDNCGIASVTVSPTTFGCSDVSVPVVLTVTDNSGNVSTANAVVTVNDPIAPSISCPGAQTMDLDANCGGYVADYTSMAVASDNCGVSSITQSPAAGTFVSGTGSFTVTLTAHDARGNVASCSFAVSKQDVTAPVIACPAPIAVSNDANQCGAVVNFATPTASDNCAGSSSTSTGVHELNAGDQFYDYANNTFETQYSPGLPLTFNPTDGNKMAVFLQSCGSSHYMHQSVQVPTSGGGILGFDLQYKNHNGSFSNSQFIAVEVRNPATNALIQTVFKTLPGDPIAIPMTHFTFDLSAYAGQTVRLQIIDATINNFYFDVLLDNITLSGSNLVNGSFETGDYTGWAIGSNNGYCGTFGIGSGLGVSVVQTAGLASGSLYPVGTTTNTFVATDLSGNTSSCSFDVVVTDTQAPVINCSADVSVYATSAAGAAVTYAAPSVSDNCAGSTSSLSSGLASGSTFPIGTTVVSYMATDAAGNTSSCSFNVEVIGLPPVAECPADITVSSDAGSCGAIVNFAAVDNTGIPASTITYSHQPGSYFPLGATVVTATATNSVGSSSCSFTITVNDTEAPVVTCPANISVSNDAGVCGAAVTYEAQASDNCSATITYSHASGSVFPIGSTTVTATATDPSGNSSSCSFVITVNDTEAPVVTCPANIAVTNDAGVCGAVVNYTSTATDNCSAVVTYSHASGSFFPVGSTVVTTTAIDPAGNSVSCSFTIVVTDTEAPIALAKNISVTLSNGMATITPASINNGSTDNCAIASMTISKNKFTCAEIGNHTVTLTVTDIHGNVSSAASTVSVQGAVPTCSITSVPSNNTYTGGNVNTLYLGYGAQSTTLSSAVTGGTGFTYSWSGQGLSCTTCANPVFTPTSEGNYSFTLTVTNSNGCQSTCTISICVFNVEVPGNKGKSSGKVYICKVPPGNPGNSHTIEVSVNAVQSHLNTGSYLGACGTNVCSALAAKANTTESDVIENRLNLATENFDLSIFPNPSNGLFHVNFTSSITGTYQMNIYEISGKLIQTSTGNANTIEDIQLNVVPGTYLVEVIQGDYRGTLRIVKN